MLPDYRSMYFKLASKVADAIEILIAVQQECEDNYTSFEEPTTITLNLDDNS